MPHIIIEYSANLDDVTDVQTLVDAVHAAALDDGLASVDALRTRAVVRDLYRVATGDPTFGFVSVIARIGPGRDADAKTRFLTRLIDTVESELAQVLATNPLALSVELQEIDGEFRINRNHVRPRITDTSGPGDD